MGEEISVERFKKTVGNSPKQSTRFPVRMTRRKFLGLAGAGAGVLVTRQLIQSSSDGGKQDKNVVTVGGNEVAIKSVLDEQGLIFGDLSKSKDVSNKVEGSLKFFDRTALQSTSEFDQLIRDEAKRHEIPEYLLFGLVLTESKGNRYAISHAGAKGLTQMMPDKAREHGLYVNNDYGEYDPNDQDERYNPEKIIPATVDELWKKFERLGNWGLVFWEWNLGEGNLWNALNVYFKGSLPGQNYKQFLKQSRVSVHDVLENIEVQNYLINTDVNWEETKIFVYNVVAGSQLYKQFRPPVS